MIGRMFRFHGLNSLRFAYKQGKTARTELCSLKYAANPRRERYRLAVVVSKKVSKSAVVRNRIRRRMYEAAREQLNQDMAYDLILTAHSDKLQAISKKDINAIISRLLQISGLIKSGGGGVVDNSAEPIKNIL